MSRRPQQTLDSYIQAAIVANAPTSQKSSKSSRRRRKKKLLEVSSALPKFEKVTFAERSPPPIPAKPKRKRNSKFKNAKLQQQKGPEKLMFRVQGLVTAEELEDDDEAEEVQVEVREDFARFGELKDVVIIREGDEAVGDVIVTFRHVKDAVAAFSAFDGNVFGGKTVTCVWQSDEEQVSGCVVSVDGMLTSEELDDPDEVADVEEEMMHLFSKHGEVDELHLSEITGQVTVKFTDEGHAQKAVQVLNGSLYGGRPVAALIVTVEILDGKRVGSTKREANEETKRAVASFVQSTESLELQSMVGTFLKRLAALQERAHTRNPRNDKRLRRLVLGMHEARRGLLANKIRLLVLATDLDGCEAVEEEIAELVAIATEKEVPVVVPMNRRKLGRVLQKSVRVSCVGVYSVEGANELYQQIVQAIK